MKNQAEAANNIVNDVSQRSSERCDFFLLRVDLLDIADSLCYNLRSNGLVHEFYHENQEERSV